MGQLILVGDRVLIQPQTGEEQTEAGLVLPASVAEQKKVRIGRVVEVGPGYLTPNPDFSDEPWKETEEVRYLPLQARPGDLAFFLRKEALEVAFDGRDYLIIPHNAILALERPSVPNGLDDLDVFGPLDADDLDDEDGHA